MKQIKVLMLGWEYAPMISGGLGVVCKNLSENLAELGVNINFVLPKTTSNIVNNNVNIIDASKYSANYLQIAIDYELHPYWSITNPYYKHYPLSNDELEIYGKNIFFDIDKYKYEVLNYIQKIDFDVIHAHDWMTFELGIAIKNIYNKPLITHVHSTEYDRSIGNPYHRILEIEKIGLENADKIIAVSTYTANIIKNNYNIDSSKISVIYNGIDNEVNNKDIIHKNDNKTVLFLGRMSAQKGIDYLLKSAQKVIKINPNINFVIVGTGEMLQYLIDLTIELGIVNNVIFVGQMNHQSVDLAYKSADLFVMPSISEPFGLTCLEAIKNGTPVIISKQSGASEVVHNCLKIDFWDIDEMANKILAVLEHKSLAQSLQERAKIDIQNLSWQNQANNCLNIYKNITNEK
jgi:glycogen synthase